VHAHSATGRSVREEQHKPWDGRKPAWGYASQEESCFGPLVVVAINYDFVGTDLTGKPRKPV